jgi:ATP-binding cassette subfamily B protein
MGMFSSLGADDYDRQYSDWYLFRRLSDYFEGQWGRLWAITGMGLIAALAQAGIPVLIAFAVDEIQQNTDTPIVTLVIGALGAVVVTQYFANWVRRRMMGRLVADTLARMRVDALRSAVERDMAFYDRNKSGKLISRITSDTEELGQVLQLGADILAQLVQTVVLLVYLLAQNVVLTLIMLAFIPVVLLATALLRKFARDATRQGSRAMGMVNDNIQESVSGIGVAKNFRQEGFIYGEFDDVNQQSYRINLRRGFVLAIIFPVLNALAGFGIASVVYVGATQVTTATISAGTWFLYIQSVDRFWFPFIQLSAFVNQFQQALAALERVLALIDAENVVQQVDDQPTDDMQGHIELKDVLFEYEEGQPVLDGFDLDIQSGESIAFVGHTGAGKSTIAKIISRFYEFQEGDILIDGRDVRSFDLESYRSRLGIVPQSPFLFSGTIMDNIRYGRPEATDEEIEEIAYSIGEGEWLETIPGGLYSDVGERGSRLSMGQRQLVALLRVLVQRPAIFILDEATASIDPFTEMQIQQALDIILSQSTSILIAHRLSTVRSADRIIVIREGEIIEQGDHDELMEADGHYAELYNTYFRHQSLSYIENARSMFDEGAAK